MSVYFDLMTSVKNSLDSISLGVPVSIRSNLWLSQDEQVPLVIVSAGADNDFIRWNTFKKLTVWNYPINVVLVYPGNRTIDQGYATYLNLREAIRNQLYQIQATGFEVTFDTKISGKSVSEFSQFAGTNYTVSGWELIYSSTTVREGK